MALEQVFPHFNTAYRHLFLPPNLPDSDDGDKWINDFAPFLLRKLEEFRDLHTGEEAVFIRNAIKSVKNFYLARSSSGELLEAPLKELLSTLSREGGVIPLHIIAQNAGILISLHSTSFVFEIFELSPPNNIVYSVAGRLRRHFPDEAVAIPVEKFQVNGILDSISNTLAQLCSQAVEQMQPRVRKADQEVVEERDTAQHFMATHFFTALLRIFGGSQAKVQGFWKNTREDVMWNHRSKLPWRRSPSWLLLRVVLQRCLSSEDGGVVNPELYKKFMIFLMAGLMDVGLEKSLSSEKLSVMNAKIARRLTKLHVYSLDPWLRVVDTIVRRTTNLLSARWAMFMDNNTPNLKLENLLDIPVENSLQKDWPEVDNYLEHIAKRASIPRSTFQPPKPNISYPNSKTLPSVNFSTNIIYQLALIEDWIRHNLDRWLSDHIPEAETCPALKDLLTSYHVSASSAYEAHPEGMSIMILVTMEIWVACDKAAIHQCPLLKNYGPEVTTRPLRALLLKSAHEMERLAVVENYVAVRTKEATSQQSALFSMGASEDLGVKFFSSSHTHQNLLGEIEAEAAREREAKVSELSTLQAKYNSLINDAQWRECETVRAYNGFGDPVVQHAPYCRRHSLQDEANNLVITAHEWPLPDEENMKRAVVFELNIPEPFAIWRDLTVYVLLEVLSFEDSNEAPKWNLPLAHYSPLQKYFHGHPFHVSTQISSQTKPDERTHRKGKNISVSTAQDVCVRTGPQWQLFSTMTGRPLLHPPKPTHYTSKVCSLSLPVESSKLSRFMMRTWDIPNGLPPNQVIASQQLCPEHFLLEEFKALTTLCLGEHIIWQNLLAQLSMPSIDLNKAETCLFVWQLLGQCGSGGDSWRRIAHNRISDERFVEAYITALSQSLDRVRESWESRNALTMLVLIAARLLTLASESQSQACLRFLSDCRLVTKQWQDVLKQKYQSECDKYTQFDLSQRAFEASLICLTSFDVDDHHLGALLNDEETGKVYLESLMTFQETAFSKNKKYQVSVQLEYRCCRLIQRCHRILEGTIVSGQSNALDLAIRATWSNFCRSSGEVWREVQLVWLETYSEADKEELPNLIVHYNLITGELLVNGSPRSRLPQSYQDHETYGDLFGHFALEVMPSSNPTMRFATSQPFNGFAVDFLLGEVENELIIQAKCNGKTWELIPRRLFENTLPEHLTRESVFWYDEAQSTVFMRPKSNPWITDTNNWALRRERGQWSATNSTNGRLLLPETTLSRAISHIFRPLESPLGLILIFNEKSNSIDISLPRFQLEFYVEHKNSEILSRQFPDMIIDKDQWLGALAGLTSKMVLRDIGALNRRTVLIPDGSPVVTRDANGKRLGGSTVTTCQDAVSVQTYHLDGHIGRLVGNGSMRSRLFLAELHAMTSSSIADPFTGQTGTESALSILRSAAVWSLDIESSELRLLERISKLAPTRTFYPPDLRVMQVVDWNRNIPPVAQSDLYLTLPAEIFSASREMDVFREKPLEPLGVSEIKRGLIQRGLCRALNRTNLPTPDVKDRIWRRTPGEQSTISGQTTRAMEFGAAMMKGTSIVEKYGREIKATDLYELLTSDLGEGTVSGSQPMEKSHFHYDPRLLAPPKSILPGSWCRVHSMLRSNSRALSQAQLATWIATLAFAQEAHIPALQALLILGTDMCSHIKIPGGAVYQLEKGYEYDRQIIQSGLNNRKILFELSTESNDRKFPCETYQQHWKRCMDLFQIRSERQGKEASIALTGQWRCKKPNLNLTDLSYFNKLESTSFVEGWFLTWYRNFQFFQYLSGVVEGIRSSPSIGIGLPSLCLETSTYTPRNTSGSLDLLDLLKILPAPEIAVLHQCHPLQALSSAEVNANGHNLDGFLGSLSQQATSDQELDYIQHLEESRNALSSQHKSRLCTSAIEVDESYLSELLGECRSHHERGLASVVSRLRLRCRPVGSLFRDSESLRATPRTWDVAAKTQAWPSVSTANLLKLMGCSYWESVPPHWKAPIIGLALSLSDSQSAERMFNARHSTQDLSREVAAFQPRSWDPENFPDSLLLEIESNIRIRQVQEDIASKMREPPSNQNAVMQLNMGEGKSSVIVPIVAASLANGSRLVRVFVAKPQFPQMREVLISKQGDLIGRRVYQMPFSRSIRPTSGQVVQLRKYYNQCMQTGGIMLVQPEQVLSLQLMTIEMAIQQEKELSAALWDLHQFMTDSSRDIVDESDENFSTKFELIYTIGDQRGVEYSPDRWIIIQRVLAMTLWSARSMRSAIVRFQKDIQLDETKRQSFPKLRLLSPVATQFVLKGALTGLCTKGFQGFPIARQPESFREQLQTYMQDPDVDSEIKGAVETSDFWTQYKTQILLVRGLFAGGILEFVFAQKRWAVNYGLDFERVPSTRLAVPFRARDSPSPRSEFSHPDVVICLTCLSYYYGGLSDDDQQVALEHLLRSDQAEAEFQDWVKEIDSLPRTFRHAKSINLRDKKQCQDHVFPFLRHSKGAIDYFLSHFVFAKEMREFPHKLSASGWDLGRVKPNALTGFSGTNDSQHVLPVTVTQLSLPDQKHTNALVLSYLLSPENSVTSLAAQGLQGICNIPDLLSLIIKMDPEIRVVLDVGALVLDMTNEQFALAWLESTREREDVQAAVFCDSTDNVCVMDRRGHVARLSVSPFASRLDRCVVFLDEAHTRGIDLRLPSDYRAIVTLGANLTKDRLIQACMRMRKLGFGQSINFLVPEEIETKIRQVNGSHPETPLSTQDVLEWSIRGTWADLRRSMPLWINQGKTFANQETRWTEARSMDSESGMNENIAIKFLQDEAQSIEVRYKPKDRKLIDLSFDNDLDNPVIEQIKERCQMYKGLEISASSLEEEQERELAPEIEQEKQIERPPSAKAAKHSLHEDVEDFVRTGFIRRSTTDDAFMYAFDVFRMTTASNHFLLDEFPKGLLVTTDFARTIEQTSVVGSSTDNYLRNVQWILTSRDKDKSCAEMVIISPYEANLLMPEIAKSTSVTLHLFAARHNQAFQPLDDLTLYNVPSQVQQEIPARLRVELNLFSGQVYFSSARDYIETCDFLCLAHQASTGDSAIAADGFIIPAAHPARRDSKTIFRNSPVKFMKALMSIRRSCESFEKTHIGRVLGGEILGEEDIRCGDD